MTAARPHHRRARRSSPTAAETLQRLTAARDDLDAGAAERRRREDLLIQQYAVASGDAADVVARRDATLANLDRRAREVRDAAAAELAAVEARQQQVLVQLHDHRTAEELSAWFGLPPKRLRQILRPDRGSGAAGAAAGDEHRSADLADPPTPTPPASGGVPVSEPARSSRTPAAVAGPLSPAVAAPVPKPAAEVVDDSAPPAAVSPATGQNGGS